MATIANLDVNLKAHVSKYNKKMAQAGLQTKKFGKTTQKASAKTKRLQSNLLLIGKVVTAVAGIFGSMAFAVNKVVQDFAKLGDEIGKAAARTQLSVQDYQTLSFAFEQSGGSAANLETAIKSLSTQYLDLQKGTSTAIDLFERLGLTFEDLQGMNVGDQFRTVANAVKNIKDPLERAAVVTKVFGRSGLTILPLIENMEAYEDRLRAIGGVIGDQAVSSAENLTDLNNELLKSYQGLSAEFGTTFLPIIALVIEGLRDLMIQAKASIRGIEAVVESKSLKSIPFVGAALAGAGSGLFAAGKIAAGKAKANVKKVADTANDVADFSMYSPQNRPGFEASSQSNSDALRMMKGESVQVTSINKMIAKIDDDISSKRSLINSVKLQTNKLAPLPQALKKGTLATSNFISQFKRQTQQSRIDAREARKIALYEEQLDTLEEVRDQLIEDKQQEQEIVIL